LKLSAGLALAALASFPLAPTRPAFAGTVTIPMRLDEQFLRRLVVAKVFDQPQERAELWRDPDGCGHLILEHPEVEAVDGRLHVRSLGNARWGAAVGDKCLFPLTWSGRVDVVEEPTLERTQPIVHFRVVDTALFDKNGRKATVSSRLWNWIKGYVHPSMESVTVDLHAPVEDLRGLLPLVLPAAYAGSADITLASVTLADARVEDHDLVIDVALASPEPPPGYKPAPEPPLDVHEVEQWDAFLTFVVKRAALDIEDSPVREALLGVLIDSRYDIVNALVDAEPGARDPVPDLFRKAWVRLAPVLRAMDTHLPGSTALRYLAFVAAGDALVAIDKLGPGSGLDISAEGLRRLARMVAPDEQGDPLEYATVVDPELRERLGFGPPLPLPASPPKDLDGPATTVSGPDTTTTTTTAEPVPGEPNGIPKDARSDSTPPTAPGSDPSAERGEPRSPRAPAQPEPTVPSPPSSAAPSAPEPPVQAPPTTRSAPPSPTSSVSTGLTRWLAGFLEWLVPPAEAAGESAGDVGKRLRNWAPTRKDLDEYLPIVQRVLHRAADDTLAKKPVDKRYVSIFRPLVLATAWKETCWRQFIRRGGKVVTMESSAGALGMMQVNPRVWRGFYDVNALRADIAYNAHAGTEILQHYLVDYAIKKKEQELGGGVDALARATYSAYNGGPGSIGRYRSEKTAKSLRAIDAEFWRVYQSVKSGNELGVRACYGP
jgi:hypothetical protein